MSNAVYSIAKSIAGPKRADESGNQDHCIQWSQAGWEFIVVADGHGSAPHKHSRLGSKYACQSASEVVEDFVNKIDVSAQPVFKSLKKWWEQEAFVSIHELWNKKVEHDLIQAIKEGRQDFSDVKEISYSVGKQGQEVQYGTTLLCSLSYGSSVALGQVGDGLIAVTGSNVNFPLATSKEELDNTRSETDSLCNPHPNPKFKAFKAAKPPRMIIACTDGIDDAFESIDAIEKWALKLSIDEKSEDHEELQSSIKVFLQQCALASGDDSTIGIIFNSEGDVPELKEEEVLASPAQAITATSEANNDDMESISDHPERHDRGEKRESSGLEGKDELNIDPLRNRDLSDDSIGGEVHSDGDEDSEQKLTDSGRSE
ncbi:protein phosphatase 2C domain-containing protein [Planctomycetota bacterium]|nr:protein phosphatase 2C domain-containing protein [Planctomycetota bacterium]MDC0347277.1 protein phosphatase 2C domain-containing protein [Planctomycetota bacterium]